VDLSVFRRVNGMSTLTQWLGTACAFHAPCAPRAKPPPRKYAACRVKL